MTKYHTSLKKCTAELQTKSKFARISQLDLYPPRSTERRVEALISPASLDATHSYTASSRGVRSGCTRNTEPEPSSKSITYRQRRIRNSLNSLWIYRPYVLYVARPNVWSCCIVRDSHICSVTTFRCCCNVVFACVCTSNLWLVTFLPFRLQVILGCGSPVAWHTNEATPPCTPIWSVGVRVKRGGPAQRDGNFLCSY